MQVGRVRTEEAILSSVDHPFLATLYGTLQTGGPGRSGLLGEGGDAAGRPIWAPVSLWTCVGQGAAGPGWGRTLTACSAQH